MSHTGPNGSGYTPRPYSIASRAIGHLETLNGDEISTARLAEAIGVPINNLPPCMDAAVSAGIVFKRQRDHSHPRSPYFWSLKDHGRRDAPNTPQGDQPRSERGREGMELKACASADGRGTDGAPARATLPHPASPGGGPMGTGQPAAAGPARDDGAGARPATSSDQGMTGEAPEAPRSALPVVAPGDELRWALWSDGVLEARDAHGRAVFLLCKGQARALVGYLDRISLDGALR